MSGAGSVTAEELVLTLQRREASLPAEIGTFIVLEACEAMLANGPRELAGLSQIRISEQGLTSLSGGPCEDEQGARALHRALGALLDAASTTLPPALARLAEQGPRGGRFSLVALRDELEAALVPLNRKASRRVLSRFAREAALPILDPDDIDAALNSLLDASDQPANDVASRPSHERISGTESPLQVDLFEGMELDDEGAPFLAAPGDASANGWRSEAKRDQRASQRPSVAPRRRLDSLHELRASESAFVEATERPGSAKLWRGLALIALAVAAVGVALSLRREGEEAAPLVASDEREKGGELPVARGDVIVRVQEPGAQILRFVGRAPVSVQGLPVGAAHEFVAMAVGHHPARVLVPMDAEWEMTAEGARYEVALQLPEATSEQLSDELGLGASRLTQQTSAPAEQLGTVRVVATPRGARVYQLVGFSPRVELRDLPLTDSEELLVYREGAAPVVRTLAPSDFQASDGRRVAELEVSLPEP